MVKEKATKKVAEKEKTAKPVKKEKVKKITEKSFFKEVKEELKKVKWPTKEDMTKYTVATIAFIVIFGLYFYGLDFLFSWIKGITG